MQRLTDGRDLVSIGQVAPSLQVLSEDRLLWKKLCHYHFTDRQVTDMGSEVVKLLTKEATEVLKGRSGSCLASPQISLGLWRYSTNALEAGGQLSGKLTRVTCNIFLPYGTKYKRRSKKKEYFNLQIIVTRKNMLKHFNLPIKLHKLYISLQILGAEFLANCRLFAGYLASIWLLNSLSAWSRVIGFLLFPSPMFSLEALLRVLQPTKNKLWPSFWEPLL